MNIFQYILYGVIVGNWILGVKDRLSTCKVQGRYAVVAMHAHKEEYVLVGRSDDKHRALSATEFVEENSMCYVGICFDLMDTEDRSEFYDKLFCNHIEDKDRSVIEHARSML